MSQGIKDAGALRPARAVGLLGIAGNRWPSRREVSLFSREAVDEGTSVEEGEVSGLRQVFQLLVENSMKEVEVVAEEEQEQMSSQEWEGK